MDAHAPESPTVELMYFTINVFPLRQTNVIKPRERADVDERSFQLPDELFWAEYDMH